MSTEAELPAVNEQGNLVELRGATVMQEDNIVLRDVNLDIKRGEFVYVIGRVGSGKTSLLKTLYAELPFEGDTSFVLGYDLSKLHESDVPYLRRRMGIVFQDFQLLTDRSVYDNLEFVLKATGWKKRVDIDKRIREVLAQVDMINKGYKKPHQLSGGEQQRVAIARALLNSPDLILADEPTGNLDPDTTVELMTLLRQINHNGKGVLMATHNHMVIKRFPARTLECENALLFEHVEEGQGNAQSGGAAPAPVQETGSEAGTEASPVSVSSGEAAPAASADAAATTLPDQAPDAETAADNYGDTVKAEQ